MRIAPRYEGDSIQDVERIQMHFEEIPTPTSQTLVFINIGAKGVSVGRVKSSGHGRTTNLYGKTRKRGRELAWMRSDDWSFCGKMDLHATVQIIRRPK